jgi:hypothetical protein
LLADRARAFRIDRIAQIAAHETPVTLQGNGIFVLHVIPFAAFDFRQSFSLDQVASDLNRFVPIGGRTSDFQITFDGFLAASTAGGLSAPQRAYVQVFRSGVVESVVSSIARGNERRFVILPYLQSWIIKYACDYASSLQRCGAEPPFAIMASLIDVKGKILLSDYLENAFPEDFPSLY